MPPTLTGCTPEDTHRMATKALSLATLLMNEKNSVRLFSASSQTSSAMRWSGLSGSSHSGG